MEYQKSIVAENSILWATDQLAEKFGWTLEDCKADPAKAQVLATLAATYVRSLKG